MSELSANQESDLPEDPDESLELRDDVLHSLEEYLASEQSGDDADEVFRALGLEF